MRASTSASQARGLMSLSLAVAIRVYTAAARSPPRSETGEQPCPAPQGNAAQCALGGVVAQADAAVVEEAGESRPARQHIVDRLGGFGMARQAGALGAHPCFEIGDDGPALMLARRQAVAGREAVDLALDGEEFVDATDRLDCQ